MKKTLFIFSGLILLVTTSCSKYDKLTFNSEDGNYELIVNTSEMNSVNVDEIEFTIAKNIKDSLNIPEDKIISMAKDGIKNAKWKAKNRMTFEYPKTALIFYSNDQVEAFFMGSAENSFGVRNNVNSIVCFDKNGDMKKDKNDLPIVR